MKGLQMMINALGLDVDEIQRVWSQLQTEAPKAVQFIHSTLTKLDADVASIHARLDSIEEILRTWEVEETVEEMTNGRTDSNSFSATGSGNGK